MYYVDLDCLPGQKCVMKSNVTFLMTFLPQEDEEVVADSSKSNDNQCNDINHCIAALESWVHALEEDSKRLRSLLMKLL